jgi:hypothetical protein
MPEMPLPADLNNQTHEFDAWSGRAWCPPRGDSLSPEK